jgi:uncharacterized protein
MPDIEQIREAAEKIHSSSKGSHDWEHTLRVYKLAVRIAKKEKADIFIVMAAALLHDIARSLEDASGGKRDHAAEGEKLAYGILKSLGISDDKTARICHCIGAHRYRGTKRPASLEAKALFDADKLDSIGAVGIGRAFLFAGEIGARLHNGGVKISETKPYTREDTAYREYMVKLRHVKKRMMTGEGKRMAVKRDAFMNQFFTRLDKETRGIS